MRPHIPEQDFMRPKRRQNTMQARLVRGPHYRQYDLVTIRAAKQVG
jgi:hypothetical protein